MPIASLKFAPGRPGCSIVPDWTTMDGNVNASAALATLVFLRNLRRRSSAGVERMAEPLANNEGRSKRGIPPVAPIGRSIPIGPGESVKSQDVLKSRNSAVLECSTTICLRQVNQRIGLSTGASGVKAGWDDDGTCSADEGPSMCKDRPMN